jgi:hypothetical protein
MGGDVMTYADWYNYNGKEPVRPRAGGGYGLVSGKPASIHPRPARHLTAMMRGHDAYYGIQATSTSN